MKIGTNKTFCLTIALLAAIFVCLGCTKQKTILSRPVTPVTDTTKRDTMPATDTMPAPDTTHVPAVAKYLALGDSYTIGQSVAPAERFPAQTVQLLKAQNVSISDPVYIAQTGWTTTSLMSAITAQNPAADFDIVTLLIGVNDQYQRHDTTGYAARFEELLNKAIFLAGRRKERVFVVSIPDYSVTPFAASSDRAFISKQIDQFNAINKAITLQYGIAYTDITPSTRQAQNDPSLIANDGLHPSGKEYKKWADLLAPKMKAVLK